MTAAGCHTAPVTVTVPDPWNDVLMVTLESSSETSGPFLALDNPGASSGNLFKATTDTMSGTNRRVSSIQGQPGAEYEFKIAGTLPKAYYLNLSTDIFGKVFITNSLAQAAAGGGRSLESTSVRVEAFVGKQRVGGEIISYNAATSSGPWAAFAFQIRPEVDAFPKGEDLSFVITRYSGPADFWIGTGGAQQSYFEVRYFADDPLAGALYLDRGQLLKSPGGGESAPDTLDRAQAFAKRPGFEKLPNTIILLPEDEASDRSSALGLAGLGLAPMAFLALPRRGRKGGAILGALLLAGVGISGCLVAESSAPNTDDDEDGPKPTVSVSYEDKNDTDETKTGAVGDIEGFVHDENGLAIGGAHVSLLGTSQFTRTSQAGVFGFKDVQENVYALRIDADRFLPIEQTIEVHGGKITKLNVTMVYPVDKQSNAKPHTHDAWGGATEKVIQTLSFWPMTCLSACQVGVSEAAGSWTCLGLDPLLPCETEIPLDYTQTVPPGTGDLEVVLKWTGSSAPRELGLRVQNSVRFEVGQDFAPRPSGDAFHVAMFPNEADPGHQAFTTWQMFVRSVPASDLYSPSSPAAYSAGKINVEVTAHKRVVPFEPSHRDFWGNQTEFALFKDARLAYTCIGCAPPAAGYQWFPPKGMFIPPGTKDIKGTMTFKHDYNPAFPFPFYLYYKPANVPPTLATSGLVRATIDQRSGDTITFTITPKPEEVDQFYQSASLWIFYPGDEDPKDTNGSAATAAAYPGVFTITATAHKDPGWTDAA